MEGCVFGEDHVGECLTAEEVCDKSATCVLRKDHVGECLTEEELRAQLSAIMTQSIDSSITVTTPTDGKISAYFGEELQAVVKVSCPKGAENVFFVKLDTDRAHLVEVPASWTEEEDGYSFTVDNGEADTTAEFTLTFVSDENAAEENSNPASVSLYGGSGENADKAKAAAEAEEAAGAQGNGLTLTWSATSDKLQYSIDLYWKTADESQKYERSIDTVQKTTLDTTYVLTIETSSGNYPVGSMEVRLPYALWMYRADSKGKVEPCLPSQIAVPEKPAHPVDGDVRYHYYVDDHENDDPSDDELVFTNWCEISGGTNTTIEVKYTIETEKTIDM